MSSSSARSVDEAAIVSRYLAQLDVFMQLLNETNLKFGNENVSSGKKLVDGM